MKYQFLAPNLTLIPETPEDYAMLRLLRQKDAPAGLPLAARPCPFCGSGDIMAESTYGRLTMVCQKCIARGPQVQKANLDNLEAALLAWNTRP